MKTDAELTYEIRLIALSVIGLIEKEPEKNESFKSAGFDQIVDVLIDEHKEKDND